MSVSVSPEFYFDTQKLSNHKEVSKNSMDTDTTIAGADAVSSAYCVM